MAESLPRIGLTLGDPAGIGPEVAAKALFDESIAGLAKFAVFGYPPLKWMELGGRVPSFITHSHPPEEWDGHMAGVELIHSGGSPDVKSRVATRAGGEASIRCILAAIEAAKRGWIDAIVTAPISKEAIGMAGYPWPGHTELLAEKFGAPEVAMMFAGGPFRVILVTIHVSLTEAIHSISAERILWACRLGSAALRRWFGIPVPRLGVCGLNPHAGEAGRFGHEEREIIQPAIEQAVQEGIAAFGPLPPDTAFLQAARGRFDLIVAMYHDQGLIPLKTVAFDEAVNMTMGLPTIRTSVDHGTAYDIAGRDAANPGSMKAAIRMAVEMIRHDRKIAK
ncbi:MAG: 4-hydroxythreonine-4-phosphate dehydrogenase PdxA [Planctomycetota bacterium]|nr:4-hydroxythreonine-4-phosphate dehydrogenase PdxA [Planctomycetota bacterium]